MQNYKDLKVWEKAHAFTLKVSANEAEYFLLLARDLNYLQEENYLELTDNINAIKAMLISLIGKVRDNVQRKTYNV